MEQNTTGQPTQNQASIDISEASKSSSKFGLITLKIITSIILLTGGYYLGTKNMFTSNNAIKLTTTPSPIPSLSISSSMNHFKDPDLQGMEFNYDQKIWDVKKCNPEDASVDKEFQSCLGIIAINRNNQDVLMLSYIFNFGIGGGARAFRRSDVDIIDDYWSRIKTDSSKYKNKPMYMYGLKEKLIYYNQNKTKKDFVDKHCSDCAKGEGMCLFSDKECGEIKDGTIIGHVEQPAYSWSFRLKNITPLDKIDGIDNSTLNEIRNRKLDDGYITVQIDYYGNNPEEADKIVKQLRAK
jgi:hypothetical protein